jgi:hypothetical protein
MSILNEKRVLRMLREVWKGSGRGSKKLKK